jgi:hypothetical protein
MESPAGKGSILGAANIISRLLWSAAIHFIAAFNLACGAVAGFSRLLSNSVFFSLAIVDRRNAATNSELLT